MTKIIFMGTPQFSVTVLDGLLEAGYDVIAVVTQPDKKVGRKQKIVATPVKEFALKHNLPVYQPVKLSGSPELTELIEQQTDLIITAAYGQFLPTSFLNSARIAAVNVHGSLLPKYRGGAPIQYAVMNGDQETGITIMEMVKQMDAGDMYAQQALTITDQDTTGTMFTKLAILGRDLLLETLPGIIAGTVKKTPQDEALVTFSPNIRKEEEQLRTKMTAKQAHNVIRGLNPDPGAFMFFNGARLKVWQSEVVDVVTPYEAGFLVNNKRELTISLANGTVLRLLEVQPVGGKRMKASDFLNGRAKNLVVGTRVMTDE